MGLVRKVRGTWEKIKTAIHLFLSPIGHLIGILILVIFGVVFVYVVGKVIEHTIGTIFVDDYAGISTTEDYETIIGSMGYSGYDAYISEEKWQEFSAFEYQILMDVAEHMYSYQDYVTELSTSDGKKYTTSAVFPEGIIKTKYNAGAITKDDWKKYVVQGQAGNAPETFATAGEEVVGGNRNVVTPRIIYEIADHEYEDDAYSLMPYLVVVREDMELNYFLTGLGKGVMNKYNNFDEISVADLGGTSAKVEPVRFSAELNRFNVNMPVSAYKKDLEEDVKNKLIKGVDDENSFVDADREKLGYGDDIYYTEQTTEIVYKIPLRLLINRYLPKSTLLTTWYMLKPDDPTGNGFNIDEVLGAIKQVYEAACYGQPTDIIIPEITTTGSKNEETGEIEKKGSGIKLRGSSFGENNETRTVTAIKYSGDGSIIRDENGKAVTGQRSINVATTNYKTFIYFEQYGLETSMYEKYVAYKSPSGDNPPHDADEARPEAKSPSARYLTRDRVNFIKSLNLQLKDIKYMNSAGVQETKEKLNVRLKPTYTLDSGLDEGTESEKIDEKLKSRYVYGENIISIDQSEPYAFMQVVRERFESTLSNEDIEKPSGEDEYIYKHKFMNQFYLRAKVGKILTQEEQDDVRYLDFKTNELKFKLPEDYRYYNQDENMPKWFDFKYYQKDSSDNAKQKEVEEGYLKAFNDLYASASYEGLIKEMLLEELKKEGIDAIEVTDYSKTAIYTYDKQATLYESDGTHVIKEKAVDVKDGDYNINYYWEGIYVIEEKELEVRQNIHHKRMPAVLVKYANTWAKGISYQNEIVQNSLNYRNYKYLIPFSKTSLGLQSMILTENPRYRVSTFEKYYNKVDEETKGLKEADILDMLIKWEDYANKGNEVAYAYMRDLYKLTIFIRDSESTKNGNGGMLETAYSYLYIPSTISNYDDGTIQKIFWLERIGVTQGEDELNEREQNVVRYKANEVRWQNLEYDEYYECITENGNKEFAKVYALFPFGAPVVRAYYMLENINSLLGQGFKGNAHPGIDMSSRVFIKEILNHAPGTTGEHIYFYELNRLTISYLRNGNHIEDAFYLAKKELNDSLKQYALYSPVVAIAPGYVSEVDYDSRSGFYVKIIHDYSKNNQAMGYTTSFYAHLKRWPLVERGDFVGAGTILGYEGTTGRSTGNHLHLEIYIKNAPGGSSGSSNSAVDPVKLITPVFSPFYYAEKSKAIIDEDKKYALGSEYYKLERTVLLDDGLYNYNNVINGRKLDDGTVINYTPPTNQTEPYNSGDAYNGGAYSGLIWGNNVPTMPIVDDISKIMDLNLLNQTIPYEPESGDNGNAATLTMRAKSEHSSNPDFFDITSSFVGERLKWPKWYTVQMAEYKSSLVVPYYNGPRSVNDSITEEGEKDLKAMQLSLKKAGYYQKAGVDSTLAGEDVYSEEFAKVVKAMQEDLISKGYEDYGISVTGNLDVATVSAYNTMVQYTPGLGGDKDLVKNQVEMSKRASYNAMTDISIESALVWSIIKEEMEYGGGPDDEKFLALKESNNTKGSKSLEYSIYNSKEDKYDIYVKEFNREQGLMQIDPTMAVKRYKEDKIEPEDAVLFIRQPKRNTTIGTELFKEYAIEIYRKYSGDIERAKNNIVFNRGGSAYWKNIYDECSTYENRWISQENIDRLMVYAIALEAFDKKDIKSITTTRVNEIITNEPGSYAKAVLETFREYLLQEGGKSTTPASKPISGNNGANKGGGSFTEVVSNNIGRVAMIAQKYGIPEEYLLGILIREGDSSSTGQLYFGLTWMRALARKIDHTDFENSWRQCFPSGYVVINGRKVTAYDVESNPDAYFSDFDFCLELSAAQIQIQVKRLGSLEAASKEYCIGTDAYVQKKVDDGTWTSKADAENFADACFDYAMMMGSLMKKYNGDEVDKIIKSAPGVGNYYAYKTGNKAGTYTLYNGSKVNYTEKRKESTEAFMNKYN